MDTKYASNPSVVIVKSPTLIPGVFISSGSGSTSPKVKSAFARPKVATKRAAIIVRHIVGFLSLLIFDLLSVLTFPFKDFFTCNCHPFWFAVQ
jgi:hypothetical protein